MQLVNQITPAKPEISGFFNVNNGKVFLSFAQGYRANGKVKHKTVEKIGYVDDLIKLYDDPIAHFKAVAKERQAAAPPDCKIEIPLKQRLDNNISTRKSLGNAVPKRIYPLLGIHHFIQNIQKHLNIQYNLNHIFSLLVYNIQHHYPKNKNSVARINARLTELFNLILIIGPI